ncbi:MAG: methyltransferase domain-containing protein [Elusimicrobia bacterium]|nr:methyltransferase domain-containing protein [Elusimicrobiota bacterium]
MPKRISATNWWRNAFERGVYPLAGLVASPQWKSRTEQEVSFVLHSLPIRARGDVLDVGCGVGRHVIPLAKKGLMVTGVDVSPIYLREARTAARRQGVKARFLKQDMRRMGFDREFDAALSLFTSFGYFARVSDDARVLKNIFNALRPGGRFMIDVVNGGRLRRLFEIAEANGMAMNSWSRLGDGTYLLERPTWDKSRDRLIRHWTLVKKSCHRQMVSFDRIFTRRRLENMIRAAGFRIARTFGDMMGRPYQRSSSPRIVIVASRPRV